MPSFAIIVALIALCVALSLAVDARILTIGASHGGEAMRPLLHHTARADRLARNVSAGWPDAR
jgi:hypothetical protein